MAALALRAKLFLANKGWCLGPLWPAKQTVVTSALAEAINGPYKAELIHRRAPWKTNEAVELATREWVFWFNRHRLMKPLGYIPPSQAEAH